MSTQVADKIETKSAVDAQFLSRILQEGFGKGAWHGPDMKAAIADVTEKQAFERPAEGRHSIAEIALHHAFYVVSVRARLTNTKPDPFVMEGEDWFALPSKPALSWKRITALMESEYEKLAKTVAKTELTPESLELVLGITCHAAYHAGQIQLVKRFLA
jgi:hypothetical protein